MLKLAYLLDVLFFKKVSPHIFLSFFALTNGSPGACSRKLKVCSPPKIKHVEPYCSLYASAPLVTDPLLEELCHATCSMLWSDLTPLGIKGMNGKTQK